MSCFFCDSIFHISQNCDIYVSDESRLKYIRLRNCCQQCLSYVSGKSDLSSCDNCKKERKCFICFSKNHHSVFCSDRFTASQIFPPKIDKILLKRFIQCLKLEEKFSLIFSFPKIIDLINLKPLTVKHQGEISNLSKYLNSDSDVFIADRCIIDKYDNYPPECYKLPSFESKVFYIRDFFIYLSKPFSSETFFQLFTSKTKTFHYFGTKFIPTVTFRQILETAPNLVDIIIHSSDIEIDNLWPKDLLNLCKAETLEKIHLQIPDLNFNVESLITFLKSKSVKSVDLLYYIPETEIFKKRNPLKTVKEKFSKYFVPIKYKHYKPGKTIRISLRSKSDNYQSFGVRYFKMKKF